jgi:hypothetical protein
MKLNNAWSLRFKLEVFIWRHAVNVPKSSTTFRRILICAIFRPGICKNNTIYNIEFKNYKYKTLLFKSSCMCADALTNFGLLCKFVSYLVPQVLVDRTPIWYPMSWYRPPIYFRLFSYFWYISLGKYMGILTNRFSDTSGSTDVYIGRR